MILTEEEAKTRWCPATRVATADPQTPTYNALADEWGKSYPASFCIGSACMWWRWGSPEYVWSPKSKDERPAGEGWEWIDENDGLGAGWRCKVQHRRGFCGAAGRPE